ncbi:hypothetical protein AAC978_08870 [Desulfitobacterium sp. THU1]|uniref:hypothetical protein n=1 Tax=Desulfitobacterium sp. THU1 TaxID=3138072 RepID=UPI00311EB9CF
MNAYRPAPYSNWIIVLKIILLIIALYFSAIILSQVFAWFFSIAFVVIRIAVYFVTSILVLHFFLKLLFGYDLLRFILGSRFSR